MENVKSTTDALAELRASLMEIDEANWGPWKLDRSTRHVHIEKPTAYSLSVDDLAANNLVLTLHHLEQKTWVDNECLGGLVRASFAIWSALGDPFPTK